jgi:replication factor C subunit 3/5
MFLVDKYYNNYNDILYYSNKIIKCLIKKKSYQHLIVYGPSGSSKEYIINKFLEKIYGKEGIQLKDVEYVISGYSNINTKVIIKQSKNHLIIEPNSNVFDKYIIQEIIQNYAKSETLTIIKNIKPFKVIIINKIFNLSYSAQASLRRTMEKYSNICKFILISDNLSKIIEPLISRCLLIRIPLPLNNNILNVLLYISYKENINISLNYLNKILLKSENKITHAIWLLEMYKYNISYDNNWENIINKIVLLIINIKKFKIVDSIHKIRKYFYILFITNIPSIIIIKNIMLKLLDYTDNINIKYDIINITSIYAERLLLGTRHIIHIEAYIIKLFQIFIK